MKKYTILKGSNSRFSATIVDESKDVKGEYICYTYGENKSEALQYLYDDVKLEILSRSNNNPNRTQNTSIGNIKNADIWYLHGWLLDGCKEARK